MKTETAQLALRIFDRQSRAYMPARTASDRSKSDVIREYLVWARAKGLRTVHTYPGFGTVVATAYGCTAEVVDPVEQFSVTVTTDPVEGFES